MRKHQQKQILDVLKTINQAQSAKLYGDCQEGALSLCDFIESIEGDENSKSEVVELLVDYCELLFKANSGEIGEKTLRKHLIKIENSVNHKLKPNKIEMIFLSYKASMSDSLETIYLAAKADTNCDAYWIPIPYYEYDTTTGQRTAKMCYEGAEHYPNYIECTDWQAYDIEKRRPDVIFTFNPYDEGNFVTTVHPNFYTKRLRELTDMLVYVPYFVYGEYGYEIANHFCILSGCVYAHKVIVQSEQSRNTYSRVFKQQYGGAYGIPDDKFIALGSPKFDKCINSKRENFQLPNNWHNLIEGKRAIFFNTTINAILQGGVEYLAKLRHILNVFRNNKNVLLWWRPHPLNKATFQSMRPQLIAEYEQIISEYRAGDWGIFDDTQDLHRALTWTDGYYGDASSIVPMYQAMGKPVMVGDIMHWSKDGRAVVPFQSYITSDHIFFSAYGINSLYSVCKNSGDLKLLLCFPNNKLKSNPMLYSGMVEKNGMLYITPTYSSEILIYSLQNQEVETISFNKNSADKGLVPAFYNAVSYDKYVFFTPFRYPAITRLDIETHEVSFFDDWVKQIEPYVFTGHDYMFIGTLIIGNILYLACACGNAVVAFNMTNCTSTVYEVGKKGYSYSGISFDGEYFWLSPRRCDTPLVKWSPEKGIIREFHEIYFDVAKSHEMSMLEGVCFNNFLWLFPLSASHVVKINVKTETVQIVDEFEQDCCELPNYSNAHKFTSVKRHGDYIYVCKVRNGQTILVEYNIITFKKRYIPLVLSPEEDEKLKKTVKQLLLLENTQFYSVESESVSITDFINRVSNEGDIPKSLDINNGTSGIKIYEYVKQKVSLHGGLN